MSEQTTLGEVDKVQDERRIENEKQEIEINKKKLDEEFEKCSNQLSNLVDVESLFATRNSLINLCLIRGAIQGILNLSRESQGVGEIRIRRSRFKDSEKINVKSKGIVEITEEKTGKVKKTTFEDPIVNQEFTPLNWEVNK